MSDLHILSDIRNRLTVAENAGDQIALNQGTLYPALRKLHHKGWITAKAGETDTGRQARFYAITKRGRAQLDAETANWDRATAIVARFVKGLHEIAARPSARHLQAAGAGPRTRR